MKGITRRKVLQGLGIGIGTAALGVGCDTKPPDGPAADLGMLPPPPDGALPADAAAGYDAAAPRDSAAPPDAGPQDDLAGPPPDPKTLLAPIDTIVVLMMENRSYDHYLGALRLVEGRNFDGLRGMEWNPDPSGNKVYVKPLATLTPADPPHNWAAAHQQWNNGANDGFVVAHAGADQNDVMGYYVRDQLPITYALADNAAVCERWFSSVMGPTWPNRMFLHAATSNGVTTNVGAPGGLKSIFDVLQTAGITNKNYYSDVAWATAGYLKLNNLARIETYFTDAAAGTLPKFSILDPQFLGAGANDDHPSHDVALGQAFIATVFRALAASPQWNRSLFVLLYDENGGFYDHVVPPTCTDERADFRQLGFRVPALVAGPYVKRGAAISTLFDHVSVAATAATRWALAPLNARAAATNDLSSCIDPQLLASPQPPPLLPMVTVRRSAIARRPAYAGEHPELVEALERGVIPRHLDRRREGRAISDRVLAEGVRLGAVRLLD